MSISVRCAAMTSVIALAAGCASSPVSTPFTRGDVTYDRLPVDSLRAAAAEIERQVHEGNREPTLTDYDDLVVDIPVIWQAVRTRAARAELVNALLNAGHAWERPNGRLWIIRSPEYKKSTSSRRKDIDAVTVNGENTDRWVIYEALVDANKLPGNGLSAIQQIFFEERLAFMSTGQIFEGPDGEQSRVQ